MGLNLQDEVPFYLYTRQNPDDGQLLINRNDTFIARSNINFNNPTVIFFHGFMEEYQSEVSQTLKNAYLKKGNYNVILVDARVPYVGPNYIAASNNVQDVGQHTADFIDYLVTKGLKLDDLVVSGMSLGGQTTGIVGSSIKSGKLPKIIAYDPAGLLFNAKPLSHRLDASDADFVEVIHSHSILFGYPDKCGHVDFWINGAPAIQVGCSPLDILRRKPNDLFEFVFCSHYLSYRLGAYELNHSEYPAKKCSNYDAYKNGECDNEDVQYIGNTSNKANGNYYLTVTSDIYSKSNLLNIN
ncbi:lipase member H isoform X2 [Aethina tumida]|nr:lipase member H isoform X2 [Aethina tumida]